MDEETVKMLHYAALAMGHWMSKITIGTVTVAGVLHMKNADGSQTIRGPWEPLHNPKHSEELADALGLEVQELPGVMSAAGVRVWYRMPQPDEHWNTRACVHAPYVCSPTPGMEDQDSQATARRRAILRAAALAGGMPK